MKTVLVCSVLSLVAVAQTRNVTLDATQAKFSATTLEPLSDGGCRIRQCYELTSGDTTAGDCVVLQPSRLQLRAACEALVDVARRRVLAKTFAVDGGE